MGTSCRAWLIGSQAAEHGRTRKAEAVELMNQGKFREARSAAMDMANISPDIEGGPELVAEIWSSPSHDSRRCYAAGR